jgi:hypothetical protein
VSSRCSLTACCAITQADKEKSIGDYLAAGMAKALQKLHRRLQLAEFKPKNFGKPNETPRSPAEVFANKVQNGRFQPCKRIVLSDDAYRQYFSETTQQLICFCVEPDDEELVFNARNTAMARFVAVRNGTSEKIALSFPDEKKESTIGKMPVVGSIENASPQTPHATTEGAWTCQMCVLVARSVCTARVARSLYSPAPCAARVAPTCSRTPQHAAAPTARTHLPTYPVDGG